MIYFDYNATTPVDEAVTEQMLPYFTQKFGNPASGYQLGKDAKEEIENARRKVAHLIKAKPEEILFTSCGSEANNMVIQNILKQGDYGKHIITSSIEHPSIVEPLSYLKKYGFEVTYLPVDETGMVDIESFYSTVRPSTCFVTIMHSNNEVGTLQPISEIGRYCRKNNIPFHTDASQSLGKLIIDVDELNVDYLTIAGHKMYAPKGIGALYIRSSQKLSPLLYGARQENGLRAGTENVPYIAGLGKAAELSEKYARENNLFSYKKYFFEELTKIFGDKIHLNGSLTNSLPNTLNISFIGTTGNEVLRLCDEISTSTGSACHSGATKPSSVLLAMGIVEHIALGAVRFSIGKYTTKDEINEAVQILKNKISTII